MGKARVLIQGWLSNTLALLHCWLKIHKDIEILQKLFKVSLKIREINIETNTSDDSYQHWDFIENAK